MTDLTLNLRLVRDEDAKALFGLVGGCFAEYDGVYLEPEGLDADLNAYASYLEKCGGVGFVMDDPNSDGLTACVSGVMQENGLYQLKRLYLRSDKRGGDTARRLVEIILEQARQAGASGVELWSDTRFKRAHRFYEREGFVKTGETRDLNDISGTTEFRFLKNF